MATVYSNLPRHPEKAHRPGAEPLPRPPWIRVRATGDDVRSQTMAAVRRHGLATVCEEASCPNLPECWSKRHATFLVMGDICTRGCGFCNVRTGVPHDLDPGEPMRVAAAVKWYEVGRMSQGRAAEIAGLTRANFIGALSRYRVSPFQYRAEELTEDLRDAD